MNIVLLDLLICLIVCMSYQQQQGKFSVDKVPVQVSLAFSRHTRVPGLNLGHHVSYVSPYQNVGMYTLHRAENMAHFLSLPNLTCCYRAFSLIHIMFFLQLSFSHCDSNINNLFWKTPHYSMSMVSPFQNKRHCNIFYTAVQDQCLLTMSVGFLFPGIYTKSINPEAIASQT